MAGSPPVSSEASSGGRLGPAHAVAPGAPPARPRTSLLYLLVGGISKPFLRVFFRPRIVGLEHLPAEGGFVLTSNQLSNLDGWAIGYSFYPRQARWMGKAELFDNPITRPFARGVGIFAVRRGAGDVEAIGTAAGLAREGYIVGIFPEGTRRQKGLRKKRRAKPHTGAARVAFAAGLPLVPAAIRGTERLTTLRRWHVAFGPPVPVDDLGGLTAHGAAKEATRRLWETITALEAGLWEGAPTRRPWRVQPRLRLDIRARDLAYGLAACEWARNPRRRAAELEHGWSPDGQALACFSVRSGFDALLDALALEPGSEVLVSAVTHPDMARIIEAHGLTAVPVDLDVATLAPRADLVERSVTPKTRMILVAHLFGGRVDLRPPVEIARRHGLLLVEDCAQSLRGPGDTGDPVADVSLFSFGTIKTATALGGALVRVRDADLLARMREIQAAWPVERRLARLVKTGKISLLALLGTPVVYGAFVRVLLVLGRDLDETLSVVVRAFPRSDAAGVTDELLGRIRRRASAPLLALLARRLRTFYVARLERRALLGERVVAGLPRELRHPGEHALSRTHWVVPVIAPEPTALVDELARAGLDASRATSSIVAIDQPGGQGGPAPEDAKRLMSQVVFVPVYPELPEAAVERMLGALRRVGDRPASEPL